MNSEVAAIVLAVRAKASALPFTSRTATSSGRRLSPTRSYWKAFQVLRRVCSSASAMSEPTAAASRVGLKNVFSCRYCTVSPPVVVARTPLPRATGRIGGAAASDSAARASADT